MGRHATSLNEAGPKVEVVEAEVQARQDTSPHHLDVVCGAM